MENEPTKTKVWNPLIIGIIAFIPDYIVGAVLAAINAHRLKEKGKRNLYLLISLPYMPIFWLGGLYFMDGWFTALALFARAGLAYWLYTDSKKLIEKNLAPENMENENLSRLLLVGGGILAFTVLCYLLFMALMLMFNSQ